MTNCNEKEGRWDKVSFKKAGSMVDIFIDIISSSKK